MEPEPGPRSTTSRRRRPRLDLIGAGVVLTGGLAYVGLNDPHSPHALFPGCLFKALTGWNCPACGGLRMVHDLLHGDLVATVADNVFLLIGLPTLAFWVLLRLRQDQKVFTPSAIATIAVLTVAWTVMRNVAGFPLQPTILDG